MRHHRLFLFCIGAVQLSCVGATDRGDLINLVQRVALVPGADSLDTIDPTPVGRDWRRIDLYLTEPLSDDSQASFDPSVHLDLGDLQLESFLFTEGGGIPAGGILRVNLAVPTGGLEEGRYTIRLLSPPDHRLVGKSGHLYDGNNSQFEFRVEVVAKNDTLPYIVSFEAGAFRTADQIDFDEWSGSGVVAIDETELVPPHGGIRVEFSERMRTPVPVQGTPLISVPMTLQLRVPGTTSTIGRSTMVPLIPGVRFQQRQERLSWFDSVDIQVSNREVTVIESDTSEGLELDQTYHLVFDGTPPLTSSQSPVYDVSGERLTVRFIAGIAVPGHTIYRRSAWKDTRVFRTSKVKITSPAHQGFLNRDSFASGEVSLPVAGHVVEGVTQVRVGTSLSGEAPPSTLNPATITLSQDVTQLGAEIDQFAGAVTIRNNVPDGDIRLWADSGESEGGWDVVVLRKDTVAPSLTAALDVSTPITDPVFPEFCVSASADTVQVEIVSGTGDRLGLSDEFTEAAGGVRRFLLRLTLRKQAGGGREHSCRASHRRGWQCVGGRRHPQAPSCNRVGDSALRISGRNDPHPWTGARGHHRDGLGELRWRRNPAIARVPRR